MKNLAMRLFNGSAMEYDHFAVRAVDGAVVPEPKSGGTKNAEPLLWTGVVDEDGRAVYEHDIIAKTYVVEDDDGEELDQPVTALIVWEPGAFFAKLYGMDRYSYLTELCDPEERLHVERAKLDGWYIIGNYDENPELFTAPPEVFGDNEDTETVGADEES